MHFAYNRTKNKYSEYWLYVNALIQTLYAVATWLALPVSVTKLSALSPFHTLLEVKADTSIWYIVIAIVWTFYTNVKTIKRVKQRLMIQQTKLGPIYQSKVFRTLLHFDWCWTTNHKYHNKVTALLVLPVNMLQPTLLVLDAMFSCPPASHYQRLSSLNVTFFRREKRRCTALLPCCSLYTHQLTKWILWIQSCVTANQYPAGYYWKCPGWMILKELRHIS